MRQITLLFLALLLIHPVAAPAQTYDFQTDRIPVATLEGQARFETGDDLRWADPGFDDSRWPLLRLGRSWTEQGYPGYGGFAWYRLHIRLPEDDQKLALFIPGIEGSSEVYANGVIVGRTGRLPPHPTPVAARNQLFFLPFVGLAPGADLLVAVRVWLPPTWTAYPAGLRGTLLVGNADRLSEWRELQIRSDLWDLSINNLEIIVFLFVGLAGLFLFLMRSEEQEYMWFAAYQIIAACSLLTWNLRFLHPVPYARWLIITALFESVYRICLLEFVRRAMKEVRGLTYFIGAGAMLVNILLLACNAAGWIQDSVSMFLGVLVFLPFYACILLLLLRGARAGKSDGRYLFAPMTLWFLSDTIMNIAFAMSVAGVPAAGAVFDKLLALIIWPFRVAVNDIAFLLFEASILSILLLRFVRSRREEERMKSEFEAASLVQQVIVPTENPEIPGLQIETVYKPAGEVGGDFFQIVDDLGGGALIAIGDVSGKGMPAAIAVSLLIGTFRTLAHYTHSPGEILTAMNHRMLGRSRGGFTTCLVLHVDSDGSCTIANAGHLSPYRSGEELNIESGLPLGLDANAAYDQTTFDLPPAVPLTLLTDGIVEARNRAGELFGFERTRAISTEPAERIASAAHRFGQQDDITVLLLCRTPTTALGQGPAMRADV
jgi:hypothetical protein